MLAPTGASVERVRVRVRLCAAWRPQPLHELDQDAGYQKDRVHESVHRRRRSIMSHLLHVDVRRVGRREVRQAVLAHVVHQVACALSPAC